ncbi:Family of unknown function (DUF572) domain containing protein [Elaphomyces granulatus]
MSERKVQSKYYPSDFDPSRLTRQPRARSDVSKRQTVTFATPFLIRCNSCGEYIATDEKYLSISKTRFYTRCTKCSAEICFKTDPKHSDYECEKGATGSYKRPTIAEDDWLEKEETERDIIADLEAKSLDVKRELAIEDGLDEIRARNARIERTGNAMEEKLIALIQRDANQELEDEEAAKRAFRGYNTSIETDSRPLPMLSIGRMNKRKRGTPFDLGIKRRSICITS